MFGIVRKFIFSLNVEGVKNIFLRTSKILQTLPSSKFKNKLLYQFKTPALRTSLWGIDFKNPLGLSSGFDNNGEFYNLLSVYGFSFVEIGSLTPFDTSKMFRSVSQIKGDMLMAPYDVKNKGVRYAIKHIQQDKPNCILAASILPNPQSINEEDIAKDFLESFSLLYDFVDIFVVNISNPSKNNVLLIQDRTSLGETIDPLLDCRLAYEHYKPILLKISPDIPMNLLDEMLDYCMISGIDGVVACNGSKNKDFFIETSSDKSLGQFLCFGDPVYERSLHIVKHIKEYTKGKLPIIGNCGISTPEKAYEMLKAGASLVEINTALMYEGPRIVKRILKYLNKQWQQQQYVQ